MYARRASVFWMCAAVAFTSVSYGATRSLDRYAIPVPRTVLGISQALAVRLARFEDGAGKSNVRRIVYVGDSTALTMPPSRAIPSMLAAALRPDGAGEGIEVFPFVAPGWWAYDFYFFVDRLIAAKPDAVVITFNPATSSATWMQRNAHPELAAWLEPARLGTAVTLPIERGGLTADRLILYPAIRQFGAFAAWRWTREQQARVGTAQRLFTAWLDPERVLFEQTRIIDAVAEIAEARQSDERGLESGQRARYEAMFAGLHRTHPVLQMLSASVRALTEAGISTLVFVFPLNVERFAALGLGLDEGLQRSLGELEAVVRDAGGEFLDLHALVPQQGFADAQGHLAFDRGVDGPAAVAAALARPLAAWFPVPPPPDAVDGS